MSHRDSLDERSDTSVSFIRTAGSANAPYRMTYARKGDTLTFTGEGADADEDEPLVLEFHKR